MQELIEHIINNINVRENLIELKTQLKEKSLSDGEGLSGVTDFLKLIDYDMDFFRKLLQHEDAKVRKNIIQIIGICNLDGLADDLFAAYEAEQTLFVRPEYLKALSMFDTESYLDYFEKRLDRLQKMQDAGENEKHITKELRLLNSILKDAGRVKGHKFIGGDTMSTMILTTLPGKEKYLKRAIDRSIGEGKTTLVRGGVKVLSSDYEGLMKVRCFQDMLFVMHGAKGLTGSPKELAAGLIKAKLMPYLRERISGSGAIAFRVHAVGMEEEKRSGFIKQFSRELETASGHELVNSASDYELEFRVHVKNAVGNVSKADDIKQYSVYLKMSSKLLEDRRFDYRRNVLPTSIQPYVAALIMEITENYTRGRGQILDPFCGVGTMLIERNYKEHAHSIYGVDIYGQAVLWAEEHAKRTKMDMHFINKDMADFTHKYLFDLIITNVPYVCGKMTQEDVISVYSEFLNKCSEWIAKDGVVVVYCASPKLFEQAIKGQSALRLLTRTDMYKNGKSALYVLH